MQNVEPPPDWPEPVESFNPEGRTPILLVCEHASRHIPEAHEALGVDEPDLAGHIGWDIGAAALTRALSTLLDAPALLGCYSRLLIDLNRPTNAASAMPVRSELTDIPGNADIGPAERERRVRRIFDPFHARVSEHLDARASAGLPTLLVSVHSFTPVFKGVARPWHGGVLFGESRALALRVAARLGAESGLTIGLNQPYRITQEEDYTIPVHGDRRRLPAILLEVRNDGLRDGEGVALWAERLDAALRPELAGLRA